MLWRYFRDMPMMILEIDSGNSGLKWRLLSQVEGSPERSLAHGLALPETFEQIAEAIAPHKPARVRIVNVRGEEVESMLFRECQRRWGIPVAVAKSASEVAGVRNAYACAETLGSDRWSALVAARHAYPGQSLCVVDCGSALTIDLLQADGQHLGGYIVPGDALMHKTLSDHTKGLRNLTAKPLTSCSTPATCTVDAVSRGISMMFCGLLEMLARRLAPEVVWVFTGQGAANVLGILSAKMRSQVRMHDSLVLDGLKYILP
jgi:type III pantothenate kinase